MSRPPRFAIPLLVLLLASPVALAARPDRGGEGSSDSGRGGMSMGEAMDRARAQSGGRVLSADVGEENGRPVYRIKVLDENGRVRVLRMHGD